MACTEDPPEYPVVEGGRCYLEFTAYCIGDDAVLICDKREWTQVACDEFCFTNALGCGLRTYGSSVSVEGCICERPPPGPCGPQSTVCVDYDEQWRCEPDGTWTSVSCTEQCAAQDPPMSSAGCGGNSSSTCACTLDGAPCDPSDGPRCAGGEHLATCVSGLWMLESCPISCEQLDGRCTEFGPEGEAACACE